jgi:hypothetical protein
MSEASLRTAMIRMATDEEFAARVAADPQSVATELSLTEAELATLRSLRVTDDEGGPERMQGRISRSGLFTGGALGALLDLGHIAGPDHAGFVCDEHDGIVGPDHPAGLLCDGFHPQIHGLLCDGFRPGGTDHPAGLLCDGFHPHTHSLLCNGKVDGFVCNEKPTDGFVCNGTPAGFICDGATPAAHVPHADVAALDKFAPNSLLKPGANLDLGPAVG